MKRPFYSARPGQIRDEEGKRRPVYIGRPKLMKNTHRYDTWKSSEDRRAEIKEELKEKMVIKKVVNYFKEQEGIDNCRWAENLINIELKKTKHE